MITLGFVLAGGLVFTALPDEISYERMVEITKVQASPSKEPKRQDLEILFNLLPDIPKGIKITFELERDGMSLTDESGEPISQQFVLENEIRKNIKLSWTPKTRLTCSDTYIFRTRILLSEQTPEVQKSIQDNPKRFPEKVDPWPWTHVYQKFIVGTPEQAAAEYKEMKEFVEGRRDEILVLNQEAMEEFEKVDSGKAHVKEGKLNNESLKKFMNGWMSRMAKVQISVKEAISLEPGFYVSKYIEVHTKLQILGRLISKRIVKTELKKVLDKHGVAVSALKLPAVDDFDANYSYSPSVSELKRQNKSLDLALWAADSIRKEGDIYKDPDEEDEKAKDEKKAEAGAEDKTPKKTATGEKDQAKETEEDKSSEASKAEKPKDAAKKGAAGKKDAKKKATKKSTEKKAEE